MSEQITFATSDFASNPEPRCPCILLLDVSGSMSGRPINELNAGLVTFRDELLADPLALKRVELGIVTFGPVHVEQPFTSAANFFPPILFAQGDTPMGAAITKALDMVEERKREYRANGISYYRPWIFLITDGAPTDEWQAAANKVFRGEEDKRFAFFSIGVQGADMKTLAQISVRQPLPLQGLQFRELFSWLILKPENLEKLKSCGVSFLDAPEEVFATVLNYLGKDPNSTKADDYTGPATDLLLKLRPNIRYFHSSQYINDLANGDICVAIGWAGDVWQASNRAKEAKNGVNVSFSIPKEGAMAFFDVFAMPADAKNKDEAYQFLNYLLRPDVVAHISDHVFYANANKAATPLVSAEVRENPGIYPPADVRAKLFTLKVQDPKIDRVRTRAWTKVKSGK